MKHRSTVMRGLPLSLLPTATSFAYEAGDGVPDPAAEWEHLWGHVLLDIVVIGVIFGAVAVYLLLKYKAAHKDDVGTGKSLSAGQMWAWALIPAFIFMADDFYLAAKGWSVWNTYRRVPEGALEVKVTAMQWSWEFEYENGVSSDVLKVPAGQPVVLRMSSEDVVHSFFLPKFRVKEDVMPGRITYIWFLPKEPGETYVTCTEFCGTAHAEMNGRVEILPPEEFDAWLVSEQEASSSSHETTGT